MIERIKEKADKIEGVGKDLRSLRVFERIREKASRIEGVVKDQENKKAKLEAELAGIKEKAERLKTDRSKIKDEILSGEVKAELQRVGFEDAGQKDRKAIDDELVKLRNREVEITAELPDFDKKLSILAAEFDKVKKELALAKADDVKVKLAELTKDRKAIIFDFEQAAGIFREALLTVVKYNDRLYEFGPGLAGAIFDATGQRFAYPISSFLSGEDLPGLAAVIAILGGVRIPTDKSFI